MKTQEEIKYAVEQLKQNKEKTKEYNFFGESNHEKIDAMIHVIENRLSESKIDLIYEDEDFYTSALDALEFLNGEIEIEDLLLPENK